MNVEVASQPAIAAETPPLRWQDDVILVGKTRVTLDSLVAAFRRGETSEEIAQNYDALTLSEVYQAIGFYLGHQSDFDIYLEHGQKVRAETQTQVERQHNPVGIRERLLTRQSLKP